MAYPPQQQQPLTREQRLDEQDKADQEYANQQQLLRIQQQRADADEENQDIQHQRIQFERQRLPLDLYSAQAQAEAHRANALFQQQQQAEQLRTAPQRYEQGAATLAATKQGTSSAAATEARAAELARYNIMQRAAAEKLLKDQNAAVLASTDSTLQTTKQNATTFADAQNDHAMYVEGEQQRQAIARALAEQQAAADIRAETGTRIAQQENARQAEAAARQGRAEQGATDLNAANVAHANATTAATKSAANNVILKNYYDTQAITAHQYAYLNTVPLEDQMAFAEDMIVPKVSAPGTPGATGTKQIELDLAKRRAELLPQYKAMFNVDPETNALAAKDFENFFTNTILQETKVKNDAKKTADQTEFSNRTNYAPPNPYKPGMRFPGY